MLQLSISDTIDRTPSDRATEILRSTSAALPVFSHLTYLDALHGLSLADLTYLLTSLSPPAPSPLSSLTSRWEFIRGTGRPLLTCCRRCPPCIRR